MVWQVYYYFFSLKLSHEYNLIYTLKGGMDLKGCTVAPFILRGVSLRGIDSCFISIDRRKKVYETYAPLLMKSNKLEIITQGEEQIIGLEKVPEISKKMLDGQIKGRYVVEL